MMPPSTHFPQIERRRAPRATRLLCLGGPLGGRRLYIWPEEMEVPLRHGVYARRMVRDLEPESVPELRQGDLEMLLWVELSS